MNVLNEIHLPAKDRQDAVAIFYNSLQTRENTTVEQAEKNGQKSCEMFIKSMVDKINLWQFGLTIHFKRGYITLHITPDQVESVADFVDYIYPGKGSAVFEHFAKNPVTTGD